MLVSLFLINKMAGKKELQFCLREAKVSGEFLHCMSLVAAKPLRYSESLIVCCSKNIINYRYL
jgi:hypothetical protein